MPPLELILEKMKKPMLILITITNILFVLFSIQIIRINPVLIKYLQISVQTFIAFFLIYRFHPFKKDYSFHVNDNYFIFGSAIVLLTNLGITHYAESFLVPVSNKITEITGVPFQIQHKSSHAKKSNTEEDVPKQYDKNEYYITI